ncbi:hypothetical protein [Bacillus velezensis]|uniref:hypothetical protein n=1 Tax=Bacillus velezensis TaxID=492670 RepID=UPI001A90E9AB|nr:hypothetical protein [Bacillus velezensis]BCT30487.1 hypothetical protein BVAD3_41610 [Bacillus velezensis]
MIKRIRVSSVSNGNKSPWVYAQEFKNKSNFAKTLEIKTASSKPSATNQYGRFKYNEMQYGEIVKGMFSNIEISKAPIRIKNGNSDWIYSQNVEAQGSHSSIRIRSLYGKQASPWVYVQNQEV